MSGVRWRMRTQPSGMLRLATTTVHTFASTLQKAIAVCSRRPLRALHQKLVQRVRRRRKDAHPDGPIVTLRRSATA